MDVTGALPDSQQAEKNLATIATMGAHPDTKGVPKPELQQSVRALHRMLVDGDSAEARERLERLTGRIAHDFNNILSVITSSVDLLLPEFESDDERLAPLRDIQLVAQRGAEIVNLLAASGQQQFLQPMVVDLNDLIQQLRNAIRSIVGDQIKVKFVLGNEPACVRVDPAQLRRAILHVVQNAADAMPNGGTLTLDVEAMEVSGLMPSVPGTKAVPCVMVAISDTGIGMSESTRLRAFEPFFSTKEKKDGMGLACVRGIVSQSGGAIWLDSSPNEGTTVAFYLQRVSSATKADADHEPATRRRYRVVPSVLLVDDDAPVRRAIARLLSAAGHRVIQAKSPSEALDLASRHQATLGVVLTDVVMPGMNGVELVERLRCIVPNVGFMFMSGHPVNAITDPELADRCVPFLRKPISKQELLTSVQMLLDGERWPHSMETRAVFDH